jgi:hypothetical protein
VSREAASAYAAYRAIVKAPRVPVEQRWTAWAAIYGSKSRADGDAGVGSHDRKLGIGGLAAGLDYRVSADTVVGFALSGAGTNFGLSDGLGTGRSDMLQGGVYGATRFDNYYLSASLAASYYDVSTERIVSLPGASSRLTASFGATPPRQARNRAGAVCHQSCGERDVSGELVTGGSPPMSAREHGQLRQDRFLQRRQRLRAHWRDRCREHQHLAHGR